MESSSAAKRLWHIVRVVFYMLGKGFSKDKFMMDLHLLLKRGKIAGKALGNLVTFHHHHHHHHHHHGGGGSGGVASMYATLSCRSMDPNRSFYTPREVEFSCSNTPSYPSFPVMKRNKARHHHHRRRLRYDYDAAAVAKALEILRSEIADDAGEEEEAKSSTAASPASWWGFGKKSPAAVRQLRITDSPFPLKEEEEEEVDGCIDQEAEEFIMQFYEQLRLQQRIPVTPECSRPLMGRA